MPESRLWIVLVALLGLALPARARAAPPDPAPEPGDDVLLDDARAHQASARFEAAAAAFERFAAERPDDPEAPAALKNAYLVRVGLGQETQALADLDEFQRVYAHEYPEWAAGLFWSRQTQLRRNQDRRDHAEEYLKLYRHIGGRDRELVAEAVIAQIDWRRSCQEPLLLDTCVSRRRKAYVEGQPGIERRDSKARKPRWCSDQVALRTTVHSRDRELSRAAQARIDRILAIIDDEEFGMPASRWQTFGDAWAMAIVYRADAKLEALLTREPPDDLMLGVEGSRKDSGARESEKIYAQQAKASARSLARLNEFIASWTEASDALEREYARVAAETYSTAWALIAATRVATLHDVLVDRLVFSQAPDQAVSREQFDSHCTRLEARAQPLRDRAHAAYMACFELSVELMIANEASGACLERLATLAPHAYPEAAELIGEPTYHRGAAISHGVVGLP